MMFCIVFVSHDLFIASLFRSMFIVCCVYKGSMYIEGHYGNKCNTECQSFQA